MKCLLFRHDYNKYDIRTKDNIRFDIRLKCKKCDDINVYTKVLYDDINFKPLIERWLINKVLERFGT